MSMRAMKDPPSGTSRMVAAPRTRSDQPAGAMNVLPATVVFGVSVAMRSDVAAGGAAAADVALRPQWTVKANVAERMSARMVPPAAQACRACRVGLRPDGRSTRPYTRRARHLKRDFRDFVVIAAENPGAP